jgi:iron complex outermembrane receptor protein
MHRAYRFVTGALTGTVIMASTLLMPLAAYAQEPADGPPAEAETPTLLDGPDRDLEEILVTARQREEKLQDVPISITAFSAKGMRDRNIQDAYDLAAFTPNFQLTPNLGRRLDNPIIRGQFGPLIGSTPNASFFIDGVFVSGSVGSTNIANLENVQILRGPQSAQFGRATFAGAINYITRKPTDEYEGEINARYGEDGRTDLGAWASGPIIQNNLYFFAGASLNKWDGEWRNGLEPYDVVAGYSPTGYPEIGINTPYGQDFFGGFGWDSNPHFAGDPDCLAVGDGSNPDGCAYTTGDNTELGGTDTQVYTLKLTWEATNNLQFNVKYERVNAEDDHYVYLFVPPGSDSHCYNRSGGGFPATGAGLDLDPDHTTGSRSPGTLCGEFTDSGYVSKLNIPNLRRGVTVGSAGPSRSAEPAPFFGMEEEVDRFYVDFNSDLGDYELSGRYAYNERTSEYVRDLDRSYTLGPVATGLFEAYTKDEDNDSSAQLTLASPGDRRLRWLLGAYWYDYEQEQFQRNFTGFGDANELGGTGSQDVINTAVFGSIDIDFNDDWTLSLEGRYAKDQISRTSSESESPVNPVPCERTDIEPNPDFPADPPVAPTLEKLHCEDNFYSWTPRATLTWNIKDDGSLTGYGNIAKGNKPGGYNFAYFDGDIPWDEVNFEEDVVIEEEEATTYEVGLKGAYLDGSLTANVSLFYIDWTNQSINARECLPQLGSAACQENNIVRNAGESEVLGLELEMTWFPTDRQSYTLGYGYTDSELQEYVDKEYATLQCPEGCFDFSGPGGTLTPAARALNNELGDVSGNKAPRTPKHNLALSQLYQAPIYSELEWFLRNDFLYESKKYSSPANLNWTPEQWTWNARLGLESEKWSVSFYVDNVTDEKSPLQIQSFPLFDLSEGYRGPDGVFINQDSYLLLPRRGRNAGIIATVRFGG